jgi:hypothetical protein
MASRRQRQRVEAWQPPHGWKCIGPGIWVPSDYTPTRWELPAPPIHNVEESKADWAKCANSLPYFAFTHAWTIDVDDPMGSRPRKIPAFPYLREFFAAVQKPENVLTDKSRQMLLRCFIRTGKRSYSRSARRMLTTAARTRRSIATSERSGSCIRTYRSICMSRSSTKRSRSSYRPRDRRSSERPVKAAWRRAVQHGIAR